MIWGNYHDSLGTIMNIPFILVPPPKRIKDTAKETRSSLGLQMILHWYRQEVSCCDFEVPKKGGYEFPKRQHFMSVSISLTVVHMDGKFIQN